MFDKNSSFNALVSPVIAFYANLAPWFALALALVLVSYRYEILAAKKQKRLTREILNWRNPINKAVDYICWTTVAGFCSQSFGVILGVPVVSMAILILVYGYEVVRTMNNYFRYKGINKRINFFKLFKDKVNNDILEDPNETDTD